MAWIELHQTLPQNKKTMKLKRILKIKTPQAVGHLCMLWLWALDNADDGDLSEFSAEDIAEVCEWTKKPEDFMDALIESGFITENNKLHDWDDYAGRLLAHRDVKKEQARMRQQRYRDKQKELRNGVTQSNATVTHNDSVSNAPIPYPTVPYRTVPEYSGGDDACAREEKPDEMTENGEPDPAGFDWEGNGWLDDVDSDSVEDIIETLSMHYANLQQITELPHRVKTRFYKTVDTLYSQFFNKQPQEYDYTVMYSLIRWMNYKYDPKGKSEQKPVEMTDDDIELIANAFEAAASADKKNLAYIRGVIKRYRERGIQSSSEFWDYEIKRDEAGRRAAQNRKDWSGKS